MTAKELQERNERLEVDLDLRMRELMFVVTCWEEEITVADVFTCMRAAYANGYCAALRELPTERGKLCRDNDYPVPKQGDPA